MAASAGTSASSLTLSSVSPPKLAAFSPRRAENFPVPVSSRCRSRLRSYGTSFRVLASVSTPNLGVRTGPEDLVASIISKVSQSDRGVLLKKEEHDKVAEEARELQKYCVDEPVKCPLIFGEWDVAYCSVPTSPGGGYRSAFGRIFLKTTEMIQGLKAPDIVTNKVAFSLLGLVDGEVSLTGKLKALNDEWVQVIFEPPELKFGSLEFRYGGESEVKLQITYIDDKIRLGKGSRGSLFVFLRRN